TPRSSSRRGGTPARSSTGTAPSRPTPRWGRRSPSSSTPSAPSSSTAPDTLVRATGVGDGSPREPLALRDFRSYWYADAIGAVGLAITPVVVDVLVVGVLDASETEVGLVRAAQFLPYLLVGLLAGACVDRWRRRPTLVVTNVAQGVLLLLVPALHLLGLLSVTAVALVLLAAGGCAVFTAAAEQSYLPDLVPRRLLVVANARTGQSATVAQTSGPALGGMLVG